MSQFRFILSKDLELVRGSAPKHAGKNRANPIAAVLAAKMMLDWRIETAVEKVLGEEKLRRIIWVGKAIIEKVPERG